MRFKAGLALLVFLLVAGTGGYMVLGLSMGDAVYQTVITTTTVGYRELGHVTDAYKAFTVVLIMLGTGTALYTLGVLLEAVFEGHLDDPLRRRRMQAEIDRLSGHVILAGFGQVGRAILHDLVQAGRNVVVVDRHPLDADHHLKFHAPGLAVPDEVDHIVVGEATDDHVLLAAGVQRAHSLVLALDSDADNLYVVLTARTLAPGLIIVARVNEAEAAPKLLRAGADQVVNPHQIGGSHMAALVVDPTAARSGS